jgi:hypothetical protein
MTTTNRPTGNMPNAQSRPYRDSQGDGQKGFGASDAGGWFKGKPQQVSNKAYKDRQSSGQKGFGSLPKKWW